MPSSALINTLQKIAGRDGVLYRPEDVMTYEYDAGLSKGTPSLVVFPRTSKEVSRIVRMANQEGISIVARGAGTGLSGGSISRDHGMVLAFSRMNRILEIDTANQRAVVQSGVVNADLSAAVASEGLYFAPDPGSQRAATLGGHVAENSGGPHTLACGVTTNHVTGLEVVLWDGRIVRFGGKCGSGPGYDLTGFFVGSEGTIGIVTEITVKLTRLPEHIETLLAIFNSMDDAARTVVELTREGITPAAMEMMDGWTLRVVEDFVHAGYPKDSGAVLLIELQGLLEVVEEQAEAVRRVCMQLHAREVRIAADQRQRELLWKGRKSAFGAIGRISPSYYTQDGVVPRTRIPETLRRIADIAGRYHLQIFNIFHAGDGNMHPAILFDLRDADQVERTHAAAAEIIQCCCDVGGTITGEHGVGMEKNELMPLLFSQDDIDVMARLRDVFNPAGLFNPGKLLPTPRTCREGTVGATALKRPSLQKGSAE